MGSEMCIRDRPFGVIARFSITDACFDAGDTFDEVLDLVEMPLEGSRDVFMHEKSPSLGFDNNVLPNPLYHFHVSPIYLLPSTSPDYYLDVPINYRMIVNANNDLGYENNMFDVLGGNANNFVSLGYFRGCDPSIDPHCVWLGELPKKIT